MVKEEGRGGCGNGNTFPSPSRSPITRVALLLERHIALAWLIDRHLDDLAGIDQVLVLNFRVRCLQVDDRDGKLVGNAPEYGVEGCSRFCEVGVGLAQNRGFMWTFRRKRMRRQR